MFEPTDHFVPQSQLVAVLINQWDRRKKSHFCGISCFCYFNGLKTKQSRSGETSQQAVFILKEKKIISRESSEKIRSNFVIIVFVTLSFVQKSN